MPSRQPRVPSIGFSSWISSTRASSRSSSGRSSDSPMRACSTWPVRSGRLGRNSCSGGSSSRMVIGRPAMASKMPSKSSCWSGSSSASADAAIFGGVGHDHRPHLGLAILGHEHVLGAAQADALGAKLARAGGILGGVGVGTHAEAADLIGPLQHGLEVLVDLGVDERDVIERHAALGAIDGDAVALADLVPLTLMRLALRSMAQAPRLRPRRGAPCRGRPAPRARPCRPRW